MHLNLNLTINDILMMDHVYELRNYLHVIQYLKLMINNDHRQEKK